MPGMLGSECAADRLQVEMTTAEEFINAINAALFLYSVIGRSEIKVTPNVFVSVARCHQTTSWHGGRWCGVAHIHMSLWDGCHGYWINHTKYMYVVPYDIRRVAEEWAHQIRLRGEHFSDHKAEGQGGDCGRTV